MKLVKSNILFVLFLLCATCAWGEGGLQIKGKIKVLKPTTLQVKDLKGNVVLNCTIAQNGVFSTETKTIVPDVYQLYLGETEQKIYLENNTVTINGYFDIQDAQKSSLSFTGIDAFLALQEYLPTEPNASKATIPDSVKGKLTPGMAAALGYLANVSDYQSNKMLLDMVPDENRNSQSAQWLVDKVEVLSHRIVGAVCYDFTLIDDKGKNVSLKDLRGKIVVLDFCASWCGPCRKEMRSLLKIYNELKADDLEFVSVSLDDSEAKWKRMVDEEQLPWIMLWDKEGFPKSSKAPNTLQSAYGFYSIPFLVVIDKEGKLLARNIRGEQVREAILNARK